VDQLALFEDKTEWMTRRQKRSVSIERPQRTLVTLRRTATLIAVVDGSVLMRSLWAKSAASQATSCP